MVSPDLHVKYRPSNWKSVVGQDEAVETLKTYLANGGLPHCLMLTGPSGVGKTTIARILKDKLRCADNDFFEIDCASKDGPDLIRDIPDRIRLYPTLESRVWFLEEIQSLSRAGFAQQAMLKIMEDFPKHAYFLLATTDPTKVIEAIRTRCKTVQLKPIETKTLSELVVKVGADEGKKISEKVAAEIASAAEGSARRALVLLGEVACLDNEADQLAVVSGGTLMKTVDNLVELLLWKKADWKKLCEVLRDIRGEDPEKIRRRILATATSCMLKGDGNSARAWAIADAFQYPSYDAGFAAIACAAYRVFGDK